MAHVTHDHTGVENAIGTMHPLWRRLVGQLRAKARHWRAYARAFGELSSLSDHDLRDIGISRCDIPWCARQAAHTGTVVAPREATGEPWPPDRSERARTPEPE